MAKDSLPAPFAGAKVKRDARAKRVAELERIVDSITTRGLKHFEANLDDAGDGAKRAWADRTVKDELAKVVYKETMATRRDDTAAARDLGILLLKDRMAEKDWERHAEEVDRASRTANAITVEAEKAK